MSKLTDVKGVIFDYGGTIDTNSRHWAEVLWSKYEEFQVPVDKTSFREAYVHGERTLARVPLVKPEHNFHDVLRIKTDIQVNYLVEQGKLDEEEACRENYAEKVADSCYRYVLDVLEYFPLEIDVVQQQTAVHVEFRMTPDGSSFQLELDNGDGLVHLRDEPQGLVIV